MKIKELMPMLQLHGRTVWDENREALFANWSCSGFTVRFKGSELKIKLIAMSDQIPGFPGMPTPPPDWPCFGVVCDGSELSGRTHMNVEEGEYVIFSGEEGEHELRFVKLSENARGKLGVTELETDGEFLPAQAEKKPLIEIIGDSITCGFGNEAPDNAFEFKTSEENGWMSYAAQAARELGWEWNMVCESGICACKPENPMFPMHAMEDIYQFSDELYETKAGIKPQSWDFAANPAKAVVISLGTNDSNPIRFYQNFDEIEGMEQWFRKQYKKFVCEVRRLNCPDTFIVCALGSMDYYLYHIIRDVVQEIKEETGDTNICSFEFIPINVMMEGFGAAGHPSAKTHARMGRELAACIRKYVKA